ncbi:MAG: DUF6603 domain-containing protein [Candidatus Sulfotelmatobacter sp.]
MASQAVYLASLGSWVARALAGIGDFGADLDTEGLGLQMPDAIVNDPSVKASGNALAQAATLLSDGADKLDAAVLSGDDTQLAQALLSMIDGIRQFVAAANAIVGSVNAKAASLPAPDQAAVLGFTTLIARRLIDFSVINLLQTEAPRLAFLLQLLGLLDWRVVPADGSLNATRYIKKDLKFERISDLFHDPATHFANVYGWGTPSFDPSLIMQAALGFFPKETSARLGQTGPDVFLQAGPLRWSRDSSVTPPGLMLDFSEDLTKTFDDRVEFSSDWGVDFKTDLAVSGGIVFRLSPPFAVSATPKAGNVSGGVSFTVNRNATAGPVIIIGGNDLLQLTAANIGAGAELTIGAGTSTGISIDPGVFADLKQLTLSLGSQDSDGFLASLLANANIKGTFDLGLEWKLQEGLVIKAAGGLEIAIPMHQQLGIVTLDTLYLVFTINADSSFSLEASAAITGQLGPLIASVDRVGVLLGIDFSQGADKNLGPVDLSLGFKPPSGVGLAVDAGVIQGGGFLSFDSDQGQYAGALELVFADFLSLHAIGLITTKMPDGSSGFSLLIIITVDFGAGLQLGFGFTLLAVGGLLGLNRCMLFQPLMDGIRNDAIESIMFPQNVIANAPRIISDLKTIFPPQQGTFLIGPMAKLGWGDPTLISLSLGVIIEIPPGDIAILGVLKLALPADDIAVLVLQVNFAGALEFDKQRVYFFASLFDSHILFITLEGEMGLLMAWGDDANFVVSIGGFHPQFNPPPLPFPSPKRLEVDIINESFARIRCDGYFAVTSNTVQFGSHSEFFFGFSALNLSGSSGFDALIQFSPFHFVAEISTSFSVNVFGVGCYGIDMDLSLEGPTPWHAHGTASISFLFFSIGISVDFTWGDNPNTTLPPIAVMPVLSGEFQKQSNWKAVLPNGSNLLVTLRQLDPAEGAMVLHPVGTLHVSQRAVPLDLTLDKDGNQPISDADYFTIDVTSGGLSKTQTLQEQFAPAQFRNMDDAAKLSQQAFVPMDSGIELSAAGNAYASGTAVTRNVRYDLTVIDIKLRRVFRRFYVYTGSLFAHFLTGSSVTRSAFSARRASQSQPYSDHVAVNPETFGVALQSNNQLYNALAGNFSSQAAAQEHLTRAVAQNPSLAGTLHVLPQFEVAA